MSLQNIWDMSSELNINKRKLVGVQFSRSQLPKTDLTVTKNPWRFVVSAPGRPWVDMRSTIEALDNLDRYQPETITIGSNANFAWLYRYLGDRSTIPTALTVSSFVGNQLTIGNITGLTNGQYLFRRGDLVQINTKPFPYTIVNDVVYTGASTVVATTHRPNITTTSVVGLSINCGPNCQISVFCPNMPTYTLTPGARRMSGSTTVINNAIVQWSDSFQLYEFVSGS
jgi:hypothetical protein